jgi:hypothetical protein
MFELSLNFYFKILIITKGVCMAEEYYYAKEYQEALK